MGRSYKIVQYPYVEVTLNNGTRLTTNMKDGRPDYFISLTHQRLKELAATCQMNIGFVANKNVDPNEIGFQISNSIGYLRYRYGINAEELSPMYIGRIVNYTLSMREGVLNYSLSIVSRSVVSNFERIHKDASFNIKQTDTADQVLDKMKKVIDNTQLKDYYEFDVEKSDKNFEISIEEISPDTTDSPIEYLQKIAKKLVDKTDCNKYYYYIVVDDSTDKGKISLKRTSGNNKVVYTFDWGTKDTDVISWTPEYDGSYAIIQGGLKQEKETIVEDSNGDQTGAKITNDPSSSSLESSAGLYSFDNITSDTITNINEFVEKSRYQESGTLVVLGLAGSKGNSLDIVDTRIEINPIINGIVHHTGGEYLITGITDTVNSQGFTTTLKVTRPSEDKEGDDK